MGAALAESERREEALKNSEALYHSLVDTLPLCIFRKDLEGRFTFGNQAFCASLKTPLQQLVGKSDRDFYPSELAPARRLTFPGKQQDSDAAAHSLAI